MVNGPEGFVRGLSAQGWDFLDWRHYEDEVGRLRGRIFKAVREGDWPKVRPLGIPVIMDRCHQARVRNSLEPEWEARFEPRSYGFRPGRGCHDTIEAIYSTPCRRNAKRVWILDADLAGAFDRIDHDHLLTMIGDFPARGMVSPG
jgi:RNA-directed DNA polymerase